MKRQVLGKGIEALLPVQDAGKIHMIKISEIKSAPFQPRESFATQKLQELAQSIRENGLLQPVILRRTENGWVLIAGERRLKAAQIAGLKEIPAIIKETNEENSAFLSLIENLQRDNLNPVEEAKAIDILIKKFSLTQEEVAKKIGKSRPYVTNTLRILKFPENIVDAIKKGEISEGHARVLMSIKDEKRRNHLLSRIIKEHLSVRDLEVLVKTQAEAKKTKKTKKIPAELMEISQKLEEIFATKVEVVSNRKNQGFIKIHFFSSNEFERIFKILKSKK